MFNIAETLDGQLRTAGIDVISVSIGDIADKSTWKIQPTDLQSASQSTIDAFDIPAEETAWQWYAVRTSRDLLLYSCDWVMLTGAPLDASEVTAWATYRQDLRDVPDDQSDPYNILWPTPPS